MKMFLVPLVLVLSLSGCQGKQTDLPVLGKLPSFELMNQRKEATGLEDYQGKIWVANFVFTSCAGTCPMLTQRMKKVQKVIQEMEGIPQELPRIVSFSVDPERDTPEKLSEYARRFGVDENIWTFLTGPLEEVTTTVVSGFKISMGKVPVEAATEGEIFEVVHGEKFILVDGLGQIRGYYDSTPRGINHLIVDMKYLLGQAS